MRSAGKQWLSCFSWVCGIISKKTVQFLGAAVLSKCMLSTADIEQRLPAGE